MYSMPPSYGRLARGRQYRTQRRQQCFGTTQAPEVRLVRLVRLLVQVGGAAGPLSDRVHVVAVAVVIGSYAVQLYST